MLSLSHTNEVIGAYVIAGARIHLYYYLDKLKDKAIYTYTDSVIYTTEKRTLANRTGDNLGQMASELKPDEIISEVVCAGLNNYANKTLNILTGDSKTVCKVRGITLNFSASKLVNFKKMKGMILAADQNETVIVRTPNKMKHERRRGGVHIISEPEEKTYRVSF